MADNNLMPDANAPTGTGPRADQAIKPGIDYRQIQRPTELLQPRFIPKSGADELANELSSALKGIQHTANSIAEPLYKQQGQAEGAAAGQQPGFTPKSGLAAITAYGEGYNQAGHVTYVASAQTALDGALDQAEQANIHNPQGFAAAAQAIRENTLKQTPDLYQPEILDRANAQIQARSNRISEGTTRFLQDQDEAAYSESRPARISTAIKTASNLPAEQATAVVQQEQANDQAMRQALVASGKWTQTRADAEGLQAQKAFETGIHLNWAANTVSNLLQPAREGNVDAADKQLAAFMQDSTKSPEDKQLIAREYMEQYEQFEKQQGQLHAKDVQNLSSLIEQVPGQKEGRGGSGLAVQQQIDDMRQKGWITSEYARSLTDRAALNAAKGRTDDTDTYNVNAVWNGQAPKFDPKDPKAGKAVDTFFQTMATNNNFPRGSDQYNQLAVSTMQHTDIIPPVIQKSVIAGLASGDPDVAASASRLAAQLHAANPSADLYQTDSRSAALQHVLELNLEAGMSNATAYSMARVQVDPSKDVLGARDARYGADVKATNAKNPALANEAVLSSKLSDSFNAHWYNSNTPAPTVPVDMQVENNALTKEFYTRTGNLQQAQQLAYEQLQKTWATTTVNGTPQLMKFGPSAAEVPIIRSGIQQVAKAYNVKDDPSTLTLVPSGVTALSQGRFWNLAHANGDPVLDGNNNPINFDRSAGRPMYEARLAKQQAADAAAEEKARAQQVASAEQLRASDKAKVAAVDLAHPTNPDLAGVR